MAAIRPPAPGGTIKFHARDEGVRKLRPVTPDVQTPGQETDCVQITRFKQLFPQNNDLRDWNDRNLHPNG